MKFNDYPYINVVRRLWTKFKLALQKKLISYEDIEQEAYVILLTKMNKCHSKSPTSRASYFKRVMISRIKELIKEKKQEKDKPHLIEALDLEIYKNKLTKEEFDILRKYFDLGLTLKEIAEEKKISIYKVWFIKERAKKEIMPYELTHWETIEIWKKRRKSYLRNWRKLHPNYYKHWRMQKKKIALIIYKIKINLLELKMKKHLLSIFILAIASLFYASNCVVAEILTPTPLLNIVPINIKDSPIEILKIDFIEGNCCQIILENKGEKEINGGILKGLIFSKDEKIIGGFAKIISLNLREKAQQKIIIDWNKIIQANANNKIILFPFKIFFKMYNEEAEPINDIVYWQLKKELLKQVGANNDVNLLGDLKSKDEADSEPQPQKTWCEWCRDMARTDCGSAIINGICRWLSACVSSFQCQDTNGYCYYTCKPQEQCC